MAQAICGTDVVARKCTATVLFIHKAEIHHAIFLPILAWYMKQHTIVLLLLALTGLCFKSEDDDLLKDKGSFFATVDGKWFKVQDNQLFRGTLLKKSGSMDGRTSAGKTVISTSFNGPTYDKSDKTSFTENVLIEMNYEDSKLGTPENFSLALQYNSNDYVMLKDQSKVKITKFTWDPDHKHFRLSADFDCQMRSWGYPTDNKKDVNLKGHMTNIRITVPSWLGLDVKN